jgi:hypothetical protein
MIHKPNNWEIEIENNYSKNYNIINYGGFLLNNENKNNFISKNKN